MKRLLQFLNGLRSKCCFCGQPGNLFGHSDYHLLCLWLESKR